MTKHNESVLLWNMYHFFNFFYFIFLISPFFCCRFPVSGKPTEGGGGPGLRVRQIGQELQIAPYPPEQKCTLLGGPKGGVVFEATPTM